jgi:mono/diheme cytochrome c family protein
LNGTDIRLAASGGFAMWLGVWICCARAADAAELNLSNLPPAATIQITFTRDVRPILENNCLRCHGPEKPRSGFRLDERGAALKGGENGIDILVGNSAKSPLIHYVAGLVEDMEMPPPGRGRTLTKEEISVLRAWIDQGAAWDTSPPTNTVDVAASPVIGWTKVSGDPAKYRQQYWEKDGVNGGLAEFQLFEQTNSGGKLLVNGHVLADDYKIDLDLEPNDHVFIHSGWEQFRKYYDDVGLFYPAFMSQAPSLGESLYLDVGKAWVDVGLTLPNWPRLVFGYEYDYRQGDEATTEYGAVRIRSTTVNIAPASETINEGVNILKFDLDEDIRGFTIEDRFRGEFYHLRTGETNVILGQEPEKLSDGTSYFQGANILRAEKKFTDWFLGSAGWLYSKLDADSSFNMNLPTLLQVTTIPEISLGRESEVGNLNGLFGPFDGLTLTTGGQAEWTREHSLGAGTFDQETALPPPAAGLIVPFTVDSDYDDTSVKETASVHYSRIPFTALFAEGAWEQEEINQNDDFAAPQDILNKANFQQHTLFSSESSNLRIGFTTSPWERVSFSAHYRRYDDDSHYDSDPLIQPVATAYPTFLLARDLLTDEYEARLTVQPYARVKTSLTYQYETTDYNVDTRSYASFGNVIAPGGEPLAGEEASHTISANATLTPVPRVYLSGTLSYEESTTTTAFDGLPAGAPSVVPYRGNIYTVLANGTYAITRATTASALYTFSEANYGQNDFAGGVPMGMDYTRHSIQIGLAHRIGKDFSTKLQYRYDYYDDPGSGGTSSYRGNSIFGEMTLRFR